MNKSIRGSNETAHMAPYGMSSWPESCASVHNFLAFSCLAWGEKKWN